MRVLEFAVGFMVLSLSTFMANAMPITFMSGLDDRCAGSGCVLSGTTVGTYVDPVGTELDGAKWVQPTSAWNVVGDYKVYELAFNKTGTDEIIDSLFVSYDDELAIKSKGVTLFNSLKYSISSPWTKIIDVIALTDDLFVAGDGRLEFIVRNTGGPTAVIWKGTTAVSEPGTLALLGLGLVGVGLIRRKKSS